MEENDIKHALNVPTLASIWPEKVRVLLKKKKEKKNYKGNAFSSNLCI